MVHLYEVGTRAWQPDPTEGWVASELKEKNVDGDKVSLVFELENGEVSVPRTPTPVYGELTTSPDEQSKTIETTQDELQLDNNPNLPPLMNPAMLEASEDLTNLSHLNEPAGLCPHRTPGPMTVR